MTEKQGYLLDPIKWEGSIEDLRNQKFLCRQRITYICKDCGDEFTYAFNIVKKKLDLLCKSCEAKRTNIEKYGVSNPSQVEEFKLKRTQTNLERYGVENTSMLKDNREKAKQTSIERYGKWYTQTEEYLEKTKKTNLERYGNEVSSRSEEVKEKARLTSLEKYGVENPAQSEEIKKRMKETFLENYGVENPSLSEEIREKREQTFLDRYGVPCYSYIGKNYELLTNEVLFKEYFNSLPEEHRTVDFIASDIGVSNNCINDKINDFDLRDFLYRKRSKGEISLCEFLDSLGIEYETHNRSLIKPLELDIYIPSKNIAIEYNGNYWHSDLKHDVYYHQTKSILCNEKGIRLIHVFEYEDIEEAKEFLRKVLSGEEKAVEGDELTLDIAKTNLLLYPNHKLKEVTEPSFKIIDNLKIYDAGNYILEKIR